MTTLSPVTGLPLNAVPPNDQTIERALLGSVVTNPSAYDTASEQIQAEDFYTPSHQNLWRTYERMRKEGKAIDQATVARELIDGGMPETDARVLVLELAQEVLGGTATQAHAEQYATTLRDLSKKRRLGRMGMEFHALGYGEQDADAAISKAVSMMNGLVLAHRTTAIPVDAVGDSLIAELRKGKREFITPFGLPHLRVMPGDVVTLAAGTSVGKTALALTWAEMWSLTKRVVFFEYEMDASRLLQRLMAKHARVTLSEMDEGLSPDQMERMVQVHDSYVRGLDLHIEDAGGTNITQLMAKIRAEAQRGADVVFIDYIGLIPLTIKENLATAIGTEITTPLKNLARELGVVIVMLSQINRSGQQRVGDGAQRFPTKNDLRDSGRIENDSDHIVMMWKEPSRELDPEGWVTRREQLGIQDPFNTEQFELVHLGVEKNRNGATGGTWLKYRGEFFEYDTVKPPSAIKDIDRSWYG